MATERQARQTCVTLSQWSESRGFASILSEVRCRILHPSRTPRNIMQRISDGNETAGLAALCSCCISRLARVRMAAEDCEPMESEAKESKDGYQSSTRHSLWGQNRRQEPTTASLVLSPELRDGVWSRTKQQVCSCHLCCSSLLAKQQGRLQNLGHWG